MTTFLICVAFLYAILQSLEVSAMLARYTGVAINSVMLGYSIQQAVYMGTRLVLIALLPVLGYLVDRGVSPREFAAMAHGSLLLASVGSCLILASRGSLSRYYSAVIAKARSGQSLLGAFVAWPTAGDGVPRHHWSAFIEDPRARRVFLQSSIVFAVYSCGMFASFYIATVYTDYRTTISQMSGLFNALGTFVMTFFVEPRIARAIDQRDSDAMLQIDAVILARIGSTLLTGQMLLITIFALVAK